MLQRYAVAATAHLSQAALHTKMMRVLVLTAALTGVAALVPPQQRRPRVTTLYASPQVMEAAKNQVAAFKESHGGHVCDELKALEQAISQDAATEEIGAKMYELLCTSLLDYDRDEADENKLVPSASKGEVIPKDAPGLVEVMTNLYVYGIRMIPSGFIEVDRCKEIVEERLAKRVGMTGEQLDDWLDVPDMGV